MSAQVDVLTVLDDYSAQHGDPDDFVQARVGVEALIAERDALAKEVERLQADGVHTCGPHCQRIACVLRRERDALREEVAALRQQPAPVDLEQFREAVECWRTSTCNRAATVANERAYYALADQIAKADRLLSIIDNAGKVAHQPAPVVDDARMARALEWVRVMAMVDTQGASEHLPAIEEAIAAYNPNCGARTVRDLGVGIQP